MDNNIDFFTRRQQAIERMKQMSKEYNEPTEKAPSKQSLPSAAKSKSTPPPDILNLPFLNNIKTDGDTALILALALVLWGEKTDKLLLIALLYLLT